MSTPRIGRNQSSLTPATPPVELLAKLLIRPDHLALPGLVQVPLKEFKETAPTWGKSPIGQFVLLTQTEIINRS